MPQPPVSHPIEHYRLPTPQPATPTDTTVKFVWLLGAPLLTAWATVALTSPEALRMFVTATITAAIAVTAAVTGWHHLNRARQPHNPTTNSGPCDFVCRCPVRPEAGAGTGPEVESATHPHPTTQTSTRSTTQGPLPALGNTRATLRPGSSPRSGGRR